MKTFVVVLSLDENVSPDWQAAEAAFAQLDGRDLEPDIVECLWAALSAPSEAHIRTCVVGGCRLYVAAGQEWDDDCWTLDYIAVLLGTGVLEAAGFRVLIAS